MYMKQLHRFDKHEMPLIYFFKAYDLPNMMPCSTDNSYSLYVLVYVFQTASPCFEHKDALVTFREIEA